MPHFEPFRGIRYDTETHDLAAVTAPPYDVLSPEDREAFAARHPHNVVHVDVPSESQGPKRYEDAAATFRRWIVEKVLVTDPDPSFYLYRLTFTDEEGKTRSTSGVLGALEVQDEDGDVLPHEQTTPKASTDRLDLTRATEANLSPIWGLSLAAGLTDACSDPGILVGEFTDESGVTHRVERIDNPARVERIRSLVASAALVIADGHHRYGVARAYRAERRRQHGDREGPEDHTLAFLVELAEDQLNVQAIHRLLTGLPADFDLVGHLRSFFHVEEVAEVDASTIPTMKEAGALCLVRRDGSGALLVPRPDAFDGVRDLDSSRLEHALRAVPHEKTYQHGLDHVLGALRSAAAEYAVLLRPVTVGQIAATAHEHVLMPPKSTFFWPKLRTGLVFRSLARG